MHALPTAGPDMSIEMVDARGPVRHFGMAWVIEGVDDGYRILKYQGGYYFEHWEERGDDLEVLVAPSLGKHTVVENPDGTVTVSPSILCYCSKCGAPKDVHGFVNNSVWTSA